MPRISLRRLAAPLAALAALAVAAPAPADPPPWAPAHGWRKKHDPEYAGYSGRKWERDYGVVQGRCQREAVGAAIGGVVGGAVGSQIGKGEGRTVAIIAGSIIGAAVGAKVGRDLDDADRSCIAQSLELAGRGQRVAWSDPESGIQYLLTPTRDYRHDGRPCRDFSLETKADGRSRTVNRSACSAGQGEWRMR